jgi:hypothetical protein
MNNINIPDICDLGEYAKTRLINRLYGQNIISGSYITIAVTELMMLLSLMSENSTEFALSNKMSLIWEQAVLDTLFYKYFCIYSCIKYNSLNKSIIHYNPDQFQNNNTLLLQQLRTITKFNIIFGRFPNRTLWTEVITNMYSPTTDNLRDESEIIISVSTGNTSQVSHNLQFTEYKINIIKMTGNNYNINILKNKTLKDVINEISIKEETAPNNLKLIYNGHVVLANEESVLTTIFGNNSAPQVHIILRQ